MKPCSCVTYVTITNHIELENFQSHLVSYLCLNACILIYLKCNLIVIDPDMLEVGNGGMSLEEYRSHFSIWAVMKVCDHLQTF